MITSQPLNDLLKRTEFVPQAVIAEDVEELARRNNLKIESGKDDFDKYTGAGALSDVLNMYFALMHYAGHPDRTTSIYLPFHVQDVTMITKAVTHITQELGVASLIKWQRKDEYAGRHTLAAALVEIFRRLEHLLGRLRAHLEGRAHGRS